jgi:hypothetical protein
VSEVSHAYIYEGMIDLANWFVVQFVQMLFVASKFHTAFVLIIKISKFAFLRKSYQEKNEEESECRLSHRSLKLRQNQFNCSDSRGTEPRPGATKN